MPFQTVQFLLTHSADAVRTNRFHQHPRVQPITTLAVVAPVTPAGHGGAPVQRHTNAIDARQRHQGGRGGFVTTTQRKQGVRHVPFVKGFNAIRNDFTGNQRVFHPITAVRHPVRDDGGATHEGLAPLPFNRGTHLVRQFTNVEIAWQRVGPR